MKRLLLIISVLCLGVVSYAQDGLGLLGGLTSSQDRLQEFDFDNITQFRAGVAYKHPIALGFAVQPEFTYSVKATAVSMDALQVSNFELKMGYLEASMQLQWGPDLIILRPYVLAEPFVGYAVNNRISTFMLDSPKLTKDNYWNSIQRLEYGYALGGGLEMFGLFQVSAKRYVNLGSLYKDPGTASWDASDTFTERLFGEGNSFCGWMISLAFFF